VSRFSLTRNSHK